MRSLRSPSPLRIVAFAVLLALAACSGEAAPRPSFVLFVVDTLRADAVSAYGEVAGTTPALDALAARGVRFREARAHAPWTLPSHASLFTGLLPGEHGVGWRRTAAPEELVMLAERLRDAGWDTFGYSENVWISQGFGMTQGFETFWFKGLGGRRAPRLEAALRAWVASRDRSRPFFVFVNVVDPHWPYDAAGSGRWLPEGTSAEEVARFDEPPRSCVDYSPRERAVLQALYRASVRQADAKLGATVELLEAAHEGPLIWIVTSDHGELLGEGGRRDHQFSLAELLLRVPLVVAGLPGAPPAVVDAPVSLVDVVPSVLRWAGLPAAQGLPGRPFPLDDGAEDAPRLHVAEYTDPAAPAADGASRTARSIRKRVLAMRQDCEPADEAFGDLRAAVLDGLKLVVRADGSERVYDLVRDPAESLDVAEERAAQAADLRARLDASIRARPPGGPAPSLGGAEDEDVRKNLRALGYIDD